MTQATIAQGKRNLRITKRQQRAKQQQIDKLAITRQRYGVNSLGAALAAKGQFL